MLKINYSSKYNTLLISLTINILLFAGAFIFFNVKFQTNDDVTMQMIASRFYTKQPLEFLIFTNVIIGYILKIFYINFSGINWYSYYLYFIHFSASTLILYNFLKIEKSLIKLAQYLIIFYFFELYFLINLQFTTTSFVIGVAGIITFINYRSDKLSFPIIVSIIAVIISGLIREYIFYLIFLLFAPIALYLIFYKKYYKFILPIVITLIIFFSLRFYNNYHYQQKSDWANYIKFNSIRGKIHTYTTYLYNTNNKIVFDKIGWNENDYKMFISWNFDDKIKYSQEKLEYLNNNIVSPSQSLKKTITELFDLYLSNGILFIMVILIILSGIIILPKKYKIFILFTTFFIYLISLLILNSAHFPSRLRVSLFFYISIFSIIFIKKEHLVKSINFLKYRWLKFSISSIFLLIIFLLMFKQLDNYIWQDRNVILQSKKEFTRQIECLSPEKNKLFVIWGESLPIENISPFSNFYNKDSNFNIYSLGWLSHSPINRQILNRFGINEIYEGLFHENVFVVINSKLYDINYLKQYYIDNYKTGIKPILVNQCEGIEIYKITKDDTI